MSDKEAQQVASEYIHNVPLDADAWPKFYVHFDTTKFGELTKADVMKACESALK